MGLFRVEKNSEIWTMYLGIRKLLHKIKTIKEEHWSFKVENYTVGKITSNIMFEVEISWGNF